MQDVNGACTRVSALSRARKRAPAEEVAHSSLSPFLSGMAEGQGLGMEVEGLDVAMVVQGSSPVTSLDFHGQGEFLVSAAVDGETAFDE
jgi:hypothetical protein